VPARAVVPGTDDQPLVIRRACDATFRRNVHVLTHSRCAERYSAWFGCDISQPMTRPVSAVADIDSLHPLEQPLRRERPNPAVRSAQRQARNMTHATRQFA
jgi:hypothetical protein